MVALTSGAITPIVARTYPYLAFSARRHEELIPDPLEGELAKPSGGEPPRASDVRKKPRVENVPSGDPGAPSPPEVVSDALVPRFRST